MVQCKLMEMITSSVSVAENFKVFFSKQIDVSLFTFDDVAVLCLM